MSILHALVLVEVLSYLELQEGDDRIASHKVANAAIVANLSSPEIKLLLAKMRQNMKFKRTRARLIAEQKYLYHFVSRRMNWRNIPILVLKIKSIVCSCVMLVLIDGGGVGY